LLSLVLSADDDDGRDGVAERDVDERDGVAGRDDDDGRDDVDGPCCVEILCSDNIEEGLEGVGADGKLLSSTTLKASSKLFTTSRSRSIDIKLLVPFADPNKMITF